VASAKVAEGEELGSNLLRVTQADLVPLCKGEAVSLPLGPSSPLLPWVRSGRTAAALDSPPPPR
jgi:hypothetical protein